MVPPTHRKSQTLDFNNSYHRVLALTIPTSNADTQSESIDMFSMDTMTPGVECNDTATLAHTMEANHSQTTKIDVEDKTTGVERSYVMSQPNINCTPPNCKSAR